MICQKPSQVSIEKREAVDFHLPKLTFSSIREGYTYLYVKEDNGRYYKDQQLRELGREEDIKASERASREQMMHRRRILEMDESSYLY